MATPLQNSPSAFDEPSLGSQREHTGARSRGITERAGQAALRDWQQEFLQGRLDAHGRAPGDARPWEGVLDRLEGRLRTSIGR